MVPMPTIIYRHAKPDKYDTAPYGTICIVENLFDIKEAYKQISKDENNPDWTVTLFPEV